MSLVMLAMLLMLQQKVLLAEEVPLLSSEDIVWVPEKYLPRPSATDEEVQEALARRHRKRRGRHRLQTTPEQKDIGGFFVTQ